MTKKWGAILTVMKNPSYLAFAFVVASGIILLMAWLPNWELLKDTILNQDTSLSYKINLTISLAGALVTNYRYVDLLLLLTSSVLAGVQTAVVSYYFKQRIKTRREAGLGIVGIFSSMLGVGCASCGSIIITSIFGLGTTGVVVRYFPLRGMEFGIIGIAILVISLVMTIRKIEAGDECELS